MQSEIPRFWEQQDRDVWLAWGESLRAGKATKRTYKGYLVDFYMEVNKPIAKVAEKDLLDYTTELSRHAAKSSVKARIRVIRAYWAFSRGTHDL